MTVPVLVDCRLLHQISPAYVALASVVLLAGILGIVICRQKFVKTAEVIGSKAGAHHDARVTKDHHEVASELLGDVTLGNYIFQ